MLQAKRYFTFNTTLATNKNPSLIFN